MRRIWSLKPLCMSLIYAFFEWLVNKVSQQDFDDFKNGKLV